MKKEPIIRSPYAFDIESVMKMSAEERNDLYKQSSIDLSEPYTVIDVLKNVYHRDFVDDFRYSITHDARLMNIIKPSSDEWIPNQFWIQKFRVIAPESVYGQPMHDTLVDIYFEVEMKVQEYHKDGYGDMNVFTVKKKMRLRYTFDFLPCHLTCRYLGVVAGEQLGVHSIYPGYFQLDKYLLPVLRTNEDYERMARMILSEDMPEQVDSDDWLCAIDWLHNMGLGVYITEFDEQNVMGEYYYGFGRAKVYDPESKTTNVQNIDPGTILLNRNALDSRGKINSTSCHEGIHHRLAYYYFMLQMTHGGNMKSYLCKRNSIKDSETTSWTPTQIMELHANKLPAYLLVQTKPGKKKADELFESYGGEKTIDNMVRLVDDMAEYFGVTKTIARSRLYEFGYREVNGIGQYIRGLQIAPYLSVLGKNETYTIDEIDAIQEYFTNPVFRRLIDRGNYLYVDGHYCLRDSKYISVDEKGNKALTEYAKQHMDECCLVFEVRYNKTDITENGSSLHKSVASTKSYVYRDKFGGSLMTEESLFVRKQIEKEMEEKALSEKSFNQMTVDLMKMKKITVEKLAEKTGLSVETIKNMRNNPNKQFTIEAVVAVCIALNLSYNISLSYIDRSPSKLTETKQMYFYRYALREWNDLTVSEVNRKLIQCKALPLTDLIQGYNEDIFAITG